MFSCIAIGSNVCVEGRAALSYNEVHEFTEYFCIPFFFIHSGIAKITKIACKIVYEVTLSKGTGAKVTCEISSKIPSQVTCQITASITGETMPQVSSTNQVPRQGAKLVELG